ncbi:MAG TPA: hypothetical protein VME92_05650 [Acetobacteraceae bacterium]|nr:hypothetical protein [Acetobacteraceae bacterium]
MRTAILWTGVAALILTVPVAVPAATSLRGVMHSWRADARSIGAMLTAREPFNDQAMRDALQRYVTDAGHVEAAINTRSSEGRAFKRYLATFEADARTALGHVDQRHVLRADFERMMGACRSCHDRFN